MSSIPEVRKTAEQKMQRSIDSLKTDLGKIRTGRAHAGILDHVVVDYYGNPTPISQVANVAVVDARTLGVTPWEKSWLGRSRRPFVIPISASIHPRKGTSCGFRCRPLPRSVAAT